MNEIIKIETNDLIVSKAELQFDDTEFRAIAEKIAETIANQEFSEETLTENKTQLASVRKVIKAIADKRKDVTDIAMGNIKTETEKMKSVEKMLKLATENLDTAIKKYELEQKEFKKNEIEKVFNTKNTFTFLKFNDVFTEKMLNKTETMKKIEKFIVNYLEKTQTDLNVIDGLPNSDVVLKEYVQHKDLGKAMQTVAENEEKERQAEEYKKQQELKKVEEEQRKIKETEIVDEEILDFGTDDFENVEDFGEVFEEEKDDRKAVELKEKAERIEKQIAAYEDEINRLRNLQNIDKIELQKVLEELNKELGVELYD